MNLVEESKIIESFAKGLQPHLIKIEEGLTLTGDNGTKITTDVFSGFAGAAVAITNMIEQKFDFLPVINNE